MPPQEKFGSKVPDEPPPPPSHHQDELSVATNLNNASGVVVSQSLDPTADEEDGCTVLQVVVPKKPRTGKSQQSPAAPAKDKDVDFDDLLPHVGEFGTYQKILFVLMIPFAFYVAWVYFSQIFITLVPEEHWCKVPELMDLPVERRLVDRFFFGI